MDVGTDEQSFLRRTLGGLGNRGVGLVRQALNSITPNDPTDFILLLVASAVAGGASFIAVSIDAMDLTLEFDGRPLTSQQLQDMFGGPELCAADLQTRKLALGLTAAFATGVDKIQVETWANSSGVRLILTQTSQNCQPIRVCPMAGPSATTKIRLAERAKLSIVTKVVSRFQNSRNLPEVEALQERCLYAGSALTVNKLRINQPVDLGPCFSWRLLRADPPIRALELTGTRPKRALASEKTAAGPYYAVIAMGSRFPENRGLRVVAGGILVKTEIPLIFRHVSVVASAFGLESDMTHTLAVNNDTLNRLVDLINRELLEMGSELFQQRHRVEADEVEIAAALLEDLSLQWQREGKASDAQEALTASLEFRKRIQGPLHPDLLPALEQLTQLCRQNGKTDLMQQVAAQQIPILREQANNHLLKHRYGEGVRCLQQALELEESIPGAIAPAQLAQGFHDLAVLMKEHRLPGSESYFLRAVALREGQAGTPSESMESLRELADRYRVNKQHREAENAARKALTLAEETLGAEDPGLVPYLKLVAEILKGSGRYGESTDFESRAVMLRFRKKKK